MSEQQIHGAIAFLRQTFHGSDDDAIAESIQIVCDAAEASIDAKQALAPFGRVPTEQHGKPHPALSTPDTNPFDLRVTVGELRRARRVIDLALGVFPTPDAAGAARLETVTNTVMRVLVLEGLVREVVDGDGAVFMSSNPRGPWVARAEAALKEVSHG